MNHTVQGQVQLSVVTNVFLIGYGKKIRDSAFNRDDEDLDIEEYGLKSDNLKSESLTGLKMPSQSTELTPEELAELELLE